MAYKFKTMEKVVGTFVVLAILFLIAMIIMIGRGKSFFIEKNYYVTHFHSGAGISKGSTPVVFNGMNIGKVMEVKLDKDNRIRIRFFVLHEYSDKVKRNSVAVIVRPLIGQTYLLVTPGTLGSSVQANNAYVVSSDSEQGKEWLTEQKSEANAIPDMIAGNLNNLLASLSDPSGGLQSALRNIASEVSNLMILNSHLNNITGNVAGNKNQINDIIISLQQTADNLAEVSKNLKHNRLLGGKPEKSTSPLSTESK